MLHNRGAAIYGFRWQGGKFVLNPDEAPVRKLMFELFLSNGHRIRTVVRVLNERGYRSRKGKPWSATTVGRLLKDPRAKGLRRANYTKSNVPGQAYTHKPEEEWVYLPVEPIVDEETYDRVNAVLESRKTGTHPTKQPKHLFAGFIYCACGSRMNVPTNAGKYVCRNCKNRIPTDDIEEVFASQLYGYLVDPSKVGESMRQAQVSLDDQVQLLASLKREEIKIRSEMDRLLELHQAGELKTGGFGRHYEPLEERLAQLEHEVPQLEGELDALRIRLSSREQILGEVQDLGERFSSLDFQAKRQVVENLVTKIEIGKEVVSIELVYLPFRSPFVMKPSYFRFKNEHMGTTTMPVWVVSGCGSLSM